MLDFRRFSLCDIEYSFNEKFERYFELKKEFNDLAINRFLLYRDYYVGCGNFDILYRGALMQGEISCSYAINLAMDKFMQAGLYDITEEDFRAFIEQNGGLGKYYKEAWKDIDNQYSIIRAKCNQEIERREYRKNNRFQIIGGGFGISGAIKGIIFAEAFNLATGAVHGLVNVIGNTRDRLKALDSENDIYNSETTLYSLLIALLGDIFVIFNKTAIKLGIYPFENNKYQKANNMMSNYIDGNIPEENAKNVLLTILEGNPETMGICSELFKYTNTVEEKKKLFEIANITGEVNEFILRYSICNLFDKLEDIVKFIKTKDYLPIARFLLVVEDEKFRFAAQAIIYNLIKNKRDIAALNYYFECCEKNVFDDFLFDDLIDNEDINITERAVNYYLSKYSFNSDKKNRLISAMEKVADNGSNYMALKLSDFFMGENNEDKGVKYCILAADRNYVKICEELLKWYNKNNLKTENKELIIAAMIRAANNGLNDVAFKLSEILFNLGNNEDALKYLLQAANNGYVDACRKLGDYYRDGLYVEKNIKMAANYYQKLDFFTTPEEYYLIASVAEKEENFEFAIKNYAKAAAENYEKSFFPLAELYYKYKFTEDNFVKICAYYKKAFDYDNKNKVAEGMWHYLLGYLYLRYEKKNAFVYDIKTALDELNLALNCGIKEAENLFKEYSQYYQVLSLSKEKYDTKKYDEAIKGFESVEHLFKEARYRLGICYYNGFGVEKNYERAFKLLVPEFQNLPEVTFILANYYFYGYGNIEKDLIKAGKFYEKSFDNANGNKEAGFKLIEIGKSYIKGSDGLKKDIIQAKYYFEIAYANGNGLKEAAYYLAKWYDEYYFSTISGSMLQEYIKKGKAKKLDVSEKILALYREAPEEMAKGSLAYKEARIYNNFSAFILSGENSPESYHITIHNDEEALEKLLEAERAGISESHLNELIADYYIKTYIPGKNNENLYNALERYKKLKNGYTVKNVYEKINNVITLIKENCGKEGAEYVKEYEKNTNIISNKRKINQKNEKNIIVRLFHTAMELIGLTVLVVIVNMILEWLGLIEL